MSVVNHKYGYIFMHEPHTGGRSIEDALMNQHEGSQNFNGNHHICALDMIDKEWVTEEEFDTFVKFRVIRNPYDWLVTCWLRNESVLSSFDRWVFTEGLGFTATGTLFWRYEGQVDYELDYETLSIEVNHVLEEHCLAPAIELPRIGVTENKPDWRELLTVKQAKDMEDYYYDIRGRNYMIFSDRFERAG